MCAYVRVSVCLFFIKLSGNLTGKKNVTWWLVCQKWSFGLRFCPTVSDQLDEIEWVISELFMPQFRRLCDFVHNLGQNIFEQVKKWELYAKICELWESPPPINNVVAEPNRHVSCQHFQHCYLGEGRKTNFSSKQKFVQNILSKIVWEKWNCVDIVSMCPKFCAIFSLKFCISVLITTVIWPVITKSLSDISLKLQEGRGGGGGVEVEGDWIRV